TCSVSSPDYYRLRFGVGRPCSGESVSQYVLSGFPDCDRSSLEESLVSLEEQLEKLLNELP
ncbi:MAG: peptidyl-tRNA hydrolase, partial [Nitrospinota bacterium]